MLPRRVSMRLYKPHFSYQELELSSNSRNRIALDTTAESARPPSATLINSGIKIKKGGFCGVNPSQATPS